MKKFSLFLPCLLWVCFVFATGGGNGPIIIVAEDIQVCTLVSPNPSDGVIHVRPTDEGEVVYAVELRDVNAQIVFSQTCGTNDCELDLSGLVEGEYSMQIRTSACTTTRTVSVR